MGGKSKIARSCHGGNFMSAAQGGGLRELYPLIEPITSTTGSKPIYYKFKLQFLSVFGLRSLFSAILEVQALFQLLAFSPKRCTSFVTFISVTRLGILNLVVHFLW